MVSFYFLAAVGSVITFYFLAAVGSVITFYFLAAVGSPFLMTTIIDTCVLLSKPPIYKKQMKVDV